MNELSDHSFSERLLKFLSTHKKQAILIALGLILLPILIVHVLFKINGPEWLRAEWFAGDLLSYFGAVLGTLATIVTIIVTIQLAVEGQQKELKMMREDRKLSIKPHLQTSHSPLFSVDDAIGLEDKKTLFVTYPVNEKEIDKDGFLPGCSLNVPYILKKYQKQSDDSGKIPRINFIHDFYILKYSLANVGAGNAINIQFLIENKPCFPAFSLVANSSRDFVFILKKGLIEDKSRNITFDFMYSDIASMGKYSQHETICFYVEKDGTLNYSQRIEDLISMPQEKVGETETES